VERARFHADRWFAVFVTQGDSGGMQSELWLADLPNPTAASDWSEYELPDAVDASNRRVIDHGGGPALLAVIDGGGNNNWRLVYRYPTP